MATMTVFVGPARGLLRAGGLAELLAEGVSSKLPAASSWAGGLLELLAEGASGTFAARSASAGGKGTPPCSRWFADPMSRGFSTSLATGSGVIPFAARFSFGAAALPVASSTLASSDLCELLNRGFLSYLPSGSEGFSVSTATTQLAARAASCFSFTETGSTSRTYWSGLGIGATFALVYMTAPGVVVGGGGGSGGGNVGRQNEEDPDEDWMKKILRELMAIQWKLDRPLEDKWIVYLMEKAIGEARVDFASKALTLADDLYEFITKMSFTAIALVSIVSHKLTPVDMWKLSFKWLGKKKAEIDQDLQDLNSSDADGQGPPFTVVLTLDQVKAICQSLNIPAESLNIPAESLNKADANSDAKDGGDVSSEGGPAP